MPMLTPCFAKPGTALIASVLLAGCMTATDSAAPLTERLAGTQLSMVQTKGADPAAGPMLMTLRRDGTGVMRYAGLELTYKWDTRDNRDLCLTDLRLSGMPSDDTSPQCSRVVIEGDRITMNGVAPEQRGRQMAGTIRPL